jgi:osmoprotectant transport system permease protein
MIDWAWMAAHLDELAGRLVQHLFLTVLGVTIGFAVSFALSIWAVRQRWLYGPLAAVAGILYTIPSLALFAALVPITGLSLPTAIIPLVLYTLLIFIRNIVAGLDGAPPDALGRPTG